MRSSAGDEYVVYRGVTNVVVKGEFESVGDVIKASDLELRETDLIIPAPDKKADPNIAIAINPANAVEVQLDGESTTFWTLQSSLVSFLAEAAISIYPGDLVWVDGTHISGPPHVDIPIPEIVKIERLKNITIIDDQQTYEIDTKARTVGEAIEDAGILILAADGVEPALGSWLEDGQTITIRKALTVTVLVDQHQIATITHHTIALDVLSANGIALLGQDYVIPEPHATLQPGETIEVVRVSYAHEISEEPIQYGSAVAANDELELDQTSLMSLGAPGLKKRLLLKRYENGAEVAQIPMGEWISREPVNEVIGYGTNIVIRTMETPDGTIEYWRKVPMRATSYTAASAGKSLDDPAYGITASGMPAGTGIAAIDPSIVPFRSNLYIPGYGIAFAGDTGGGVKGRIIDLGYDEGELVSWRGFVDVYYLTPVPPVEDINYLLP